jgi:hypothetical protein
LEGEGNARAERAATPHHTTPHMHPR